MNRATPKASHVWPLACVTFVLGTAVWLLATGPSVDRPDMDVPAKEGMEIREDLDPPARRAEIAALPAPAIPCA